MCNNCIHICDYFWYKKILYAESLESIFGNLISFLNETDHLCAQFFCGCTNKIWLHDIKFTSLGMIYDATSFSNYYSASCNVPWLKIVNVIGVALARRHIAQSESCASKAASTVNEE